MLTDEQIAEGWKEHDGGPCPVEHSAEIAVMFGDGYVYDAGLRRAGYWLTGYWHHHFPNPRERIIAYREVPHD